MQISASFLPLDQLGKYSDSLDNHALRAMAAGRPVRLFLLPSRRGNGFESLGVQRANIGRVLRLVRLVRLSGLPPVPFGAEEKVNRHSSQRPQQRPHNEHPKGTC